MKFLKHLILAACLLATPVHSAEYDLPAVNQGWWEAGVDVGVVGGIPQYRAGSGDPDARETLVNVVTYGADPTGVADSKSAIEAAKNAAVAGQVVYFPTGTYKVASTLTLNKSGITYRGDGPSLSIISCPTVGITVANVAGSSLGNVGEQTITGTKTKGTATLTVASSSGYAAGQMVQVIVPHEEDLTRIQAGYPATWTSTGFRDSRRFFAMVTVVPNGTSITIDPPLPYDCTPYAPRISRHYNPITKVGFEDLGFTSPSVTGAEHYTTGINFNGTSECWTYRVHFTNWTRTASSGQPINLQNCYKTEIRKCSFIAANVSGDDGAIQFVGVTSALIEDNYFEDWQNTFYDTPPTINTVISYNYGRRNDADVLFGHGTRQSYLNLVEGNIFRNGRGDGYHGSSFYITMFRNWMRGWNDKTSVASYTLGLNKFSHYWATVGNVFGMNGRSNEANSYGNPNLNNSIFDGTSDIVNGDPPDDWLITGTLVTRTSDIEGVFEVSHGDANGTSDMGGQPVNTIFVWWDNYGSRREGMKVASFAGNLWTLNNGEVPGGSVLPPEGTAVNIWMGANGWQNKDLAVEGTMTKARNYHSSAGGTGAIEDDIPGDTLKVSYVHPSKPDWFGDLPWPPIDPSTPLTNDTTDIARIPAGYRFIYGVDPGDPLPPSAAKRTRVGGKDIRIGGKVLKIGDN